MMDNWLINSPVYRNHAEIEDAGSAVEHIGAKPNMARGRAEVPVA